jgi:hypothetical protein
MIGQQQVHRDPGLMIPMADMVLALMPPIKQSKKLSNLKTWPGAPVILGLLGKKGRVGSVGCDAHAIGIQKNEQ